MDWPNVVNGASRPESLGFVSQDDDCRCRLGLLLSSGARWRAASESPLPCLMPPQVAPVVVVVVVVLCWSSS